MTSRIALLGCGVWGEKILQELLALGCQVTVIEPEVAAASAAQAAGAHLVLESIPRQLNVDGLVVATPATTHRQVLEQVLRTGLPIFLEKPLTANLEDALALSTQVHDDVYLMHVWAYHEGIRQLQRIAQSGELGLVMGLRSTRANWTSPRTDIDSLWNMAAHDISISKVILGQVPEPKSCTVERHAGVVRVAYAILGEQPYCAFELSNRSEQKIRQVRLLCERGVAILEDDNANSIQIVHGDALSKPEHMRIETRRFQPGSALQRELQEFVGYLQGGPKPLCDFSDGLETVRIIHQLEQLA